MPPRFASITAAGIVWLGFTGCALFRQDDRSPVAIQVIEGRLTASIDSTVSPEAWIDHVCRPPAASHDAVREMAMLYALGGAPDSRDKVFDCLEQYQLDDTVASALLRLGTANSIGILLVTEWDTVAASSTNASVASSALAEAMEAVSRNLTHFQGDDEFLWFIGRATVTPALSSSLELALTSAVDLDREDALPAWRRAKDRSPTLTMGLALAYARSRDGTEGRESLSEMLVDPSISDEERGMIWGVLLALEPDAVRQRLAATLRRELSSVAWRHAIASFLMGIDGQMLRLETLTELIALSEARTPYDQRLTTLSRVQETYP